MLCLVYDTQQSLVAQEGPFAPRLMMETIQKGCAAGGICGIQACELAEDAKDWTVGIYISRQNDTLQT